MIKTHVNYTLTNISLVLKLSPHANEKSRGKGESLVKFIM